MWRGVGQCHPTHVAEKSPLHVTPGLGLPFKLLRTRSEGGQWEHCKNEYINNYTLY